MSLRMTLTAALGLALTLPALVAANPNGKRGESATKEDAPILVFYPVADLVVPIDYGDGKAGGPRQEEQLMDLIEATVAPKTWNGAGGPGKLRYYPLGMSLVVYHSRAVQGEVAEMLAALRRLQDINVGVELRIVRVSAEMGARFRLKAGFEASEADAVEKFVSSTTFAEALAGQGAAKAKKGGKAADSAILTEKELYPWLELFMTDPATQLMQAPKITIFNGQRAKLIVGELKSTLLSRVSADRRSVLLNVDLRLSLPGQAPAMPAIVKTVAVGSQETDVRGFDFEQQPQGPTLSFKQTNVIPDGRTMVVSLGQLMSEGRQECCPLPVLSKIPYVSRLFRNVGWGREPVEVFLLVTPRVIIDGESEQIPVNMPRQSFVIEPPAIPRP